MDLNHWSTGYGPVGISWLPHPAIKNKWVSDFLFGIRFLVLKVNTLKKTYRPIKIFINSIFDR